MRKKLMLILPFVFLILVFGFIFLRYNYVVKGETTTDKVVNFIKDSKVFFIATIENGEQPRVRPFGAIEVIDREINICTGASKKIYKQIQENPNIELSSLNKNGEWIRVSAILEDNTTDENREIFFKSNPGLREVYKNKEDFKILKLKNVRATINKNGEQERSL
jgi:uncharacterized pyridoxamine 5'-phosphate oxidase family protein